MIHTEKRIQFQPASEKDVAELRDLIKKYIDLAKIQESSRHRLSETEEKRRIALQDEITLAFVSHKSGTSITYNDYLNFKEALSGLIHELEVSKKLLS